jgi:hypothetical protein
VPLTALFASSHYPRAECSRRLWVASLAESSGGHLDRGRRLIGCFLEGKLQCQLDCSGVIGRRDGTEVAGAVVAADAPVQGVANPLRVVPNVEEFRAELEFGAAFFVEEKVLEEGNVQLPRPRQIISRPDWPAS